MWPLVAQVRPGSPHARAPVRTGSASVRHVFTQAGTNSRWPYSAGGRGLYAVLSRFGPRYNSALITKRSDNEMLTLAISLPIEAFGTSIIN